jgi:Transposase and inactivated derivatives
MNSDQGSQFTSFAWTDSLRRSGIRISMDGKGRYLDNIFIERLWRTLKYECVYLHAWEAGSQARAGVRNWMEFDNHRRPHKALGGRPPAVVYSMQIEATNPIIRSKSELKKRQILSKEWGAPQTFKRKLTALVPRAFGQGGRCPSDQEDATCLWEPSFHGSSLGHAGRNPLSA